MCTALTFYADHHYFGRNLDLDKRYDERVVITPRNYILRYKSGEIHRRHFAIIGMATVIDDYPLYYDATNEHGLSIAALNFVGNAYYNSHKPSSINITPYEIIPYLLGISKSVDEAEDVLRKINLINIDFKEDIKNSELHWIISDKNRSITVESLKSGLMIYSNDIGILTNNPPFEFHIMNLNNYLNITNQDCNPRFSDQIKLNKYSKGMGGIGLPGDNSSMSRFVRCAFTKLNSVIPQNESDCMTQVFHILTSVAQVEGSVVSGEKREKTQYMSCCDMDSCAYYYKTYNNSQINVVTLFNENIDSDKLISYKMIDTQNINKIN